LPDTSLSAAPSQAASPSPLIAWRAQPFPLDWNAVFPSVTALHLEVGFGDGRYTVRRALDAPREQFVGIEISGVSVRRALQKVRQQRVSNVALLKGNAHVILQQSFAAGALQSITVNFPDPWPKGRHEDNRLLRRSFFELAASRLTAGGSILLATDHPGYLAFAREEGLASGLFTLGEAEPPAAVFETKYALKWKTQGKPLFYQPFVRNARAAADFPHLERPAIMPHSLLQGDLPVVEEFTKQVIPYGGGHVILHEAARSAQADTRWLVRVTVDEPGLIQQLLVAIQRRSDSQLIVRLEPFGDPIITPAVRGAVHAVTEWALQQPGTTLVERCY
jgi:tRNA (guanine-N7-)-methyltransferase